MSHVPFPTAGNVDNAVFPLKSPEPENSPFADTLHYEAGDAIGFGLEANEEIPFPDAGEFTQPAVTGVPHVDANSDAERPEVPRAAAAPAPAEDTSDEDAKAEANKKAEEDKKAADKAAADKADSDKKAADEAKASKAADDAKAEDSKVVAPKAAAKA